MYLHLTIPSIDTRELTLALEWAILFKGVYLTLNPTFRLPIRHSTPLFHSRCNSRPWTAMRGPNGLLIRCVLFICEATTDTAFVDEFSSALIATSFTPRVFHHNLHSLQLITLRLPKSHLPCEFADDTYCVPQRSIFGYMGAIHDADPVHDRNCTYCVHTQSKSASRERRDDQLRKRDRSDFANALFRVPPTGQSPRWVRDDSIR